MAGNDLLRNPMGAGQKPTQRIRVPATAENTITPETFSERHPQFGYYKELAGVLFRHQKSIQGRATTNRMFAETGLRVERKAFLPGAETVVSPARAYRRMKTGKHVGLAAVGGIVASFAVGALNTVVDINLPGGGSDQTAEGAAPAQGNQSPNTTETTLVFAPAPQSETGGAPAPSPESTTPAPDFTFKSTAGAGSVACTGAFVIVTIDRGSSTGPLRQMQEATGASWAEGNPAGDALLYEELLAHPANAEFVAGATSDLAVPGNCSGLER